LSIPVLAACGPKRARAASAEGPLERPLCDYLARYAIHLVIMGAYGHSAIRRFLVGSTTTGMLRNAVAVLPLR